MAKSIALDMAVHRCRCDDPHGFDGDGVSECLPARVRSGQPGMVCLRGSWAGGHLSGSRLWAGKESRLSFTCGSHQARHNTRHEVESGETRSGIRGMQIKQTSFVLLSKSMQTKARFDILLH